MSRHDGKKIDEILFHEGGRIQIRYHSGHNPRFTVVAAEKDFEGTNLKELMDQAEIHLRGWSSLVWEPVIGIDTEVGSDIRIEYQRFFRTKHKGSLVYRAWKIGDFNEEKHGWYNKDRNKKTADKTEGEPGEIERSPVRGRIVKFTPERWAQMRSLDRAISAAIETVKERLSGILADSSDQDLDGFLKKVSLGGAPAITFNK
jgi:hypothetical protein